MDADPELAVTLSDGRQVATFRIAAVEDLETWAVVDPHGPPRVIRGTAAALRLREHFDRQIATRLAVGWVPVEGDAARSMAATPLPSDVALQIGSLVEALACAGPALRAADPSVLL